MSEECLICKAPLEYLTGDLPMSCAVCGREFPSKTRCRMGHYVCDACHTAGLDALFAICLTATSRDPIAILEALMARPACHMHGPEHHTLVGAALLTAYRNAGGDLDLPHALQEMAARGREVPGGVCGFWGACGAGISTGIYCSIVTRATPLETTAWSLSNRMTARALASIAQHGGPRCCKRNAYLAVREAVAFTADHLGVTLAFTPPVCTRSHLNNQCRRSACPFHPEA